MESGDSSTRPYHWKGQGLELVDWLKESLLQQEVLAYSLRQNIVISCINRHASQSSVCSVFASFVIVGWLVRFCSRLTVFYWLEKMNGECDVLEEECSLEKGVAGQNIPSCRSTLTEVNSRLIFKMPNKKRNESCFLRCWWLQLFLKQRLYYYHH